MKASVAENGSVTARPWPDAHERGSGERHNTLLEVFDRSVARWPGHIALQAPDACLTYSELSQATDELAGRLTGFGIGRGDRVAVHVRSGTAELYLAILGVLRSGAAYVPIDADDPTERVRDITIRSGACATVGDGLVITPSRSARASFAAGAPTSDDDAWIIFTSGTTGAPKGVAVTHGSAAAFVDAESELWEVQASDRVLAGLSVGFDASCEEIWTAWAHGAALVPAPRAVVRAGVELGTWLIDNKVTVVSTVPTLAALWDESCLHNVRLLILGGEACPEKLGWRLSAGREVWNTYGPTEATVVSTAAPVVPGEPITIGWPLRGWEVAVLQGGEPVAFGQPGELVIAGAGVARYLDPELDATRFAGVPALGWERAYRTGDIVRLTADGLQFVGRRDDQVKIGGRRIELGEVESVLQSTHGVRAAAVAVRESRAGNRLLVAYLVSDRTGGLDCEQIRVHAARRLPAGMVPLIVNVPELPMNASGKVDRTALPWPVGGDSEALAAGIGADGTVLSDHEVWVAEQWVAQLGPVAITPNSDFFALGGTSLAAAKLISALRADVPSIAVADLYRYPTLRTFSARLESMVSSVAIAASPRADIRLGSRVLQICLLLAVLVMEVPSWMAGILAFDKWYHVGPQLGWLWITGGWLLLSNPYSRALIAAAARRCLFGGIKPGSYPRNGWTAFRVVFVERLGEHSHMDRLAGTPWATRYARRVGLDVASDAQLGTVPPLASRVRIGSGATLEGDVDLHGWWVEGDQLVLGEVEIGAGARIGARSLLMPGAVVEESAEIEPGAVISGRVPAGERWAGSPARRVGLAGEHWPSSPPPAQERSGAQRRARAWGALFTVGLVAQMLLPLIGAAPSIALILAVEGNAQKSAGQLMLSLLAMAPAIALVFTVFTALTIAASVRAIGHLIRPGWHSGFSATAWAMWMTEALMAESRAALFPLYASSFTNPWLRLCGMRIGERTEISNAVGLNRLVSLGSMSFAADDVAFLTGRARGGWLETATIVVGDRSFLGNSAILAPGTVVGDDALIGLMTVAPSQVPSGTSWLGAPALELPRRRPEVDESRTVRPSQRLRAARLVMDTVRILLPSSVAIALMLGCYRAVDWVGLHFGTGALIASIVPLLLGVGLLATLITVAVKWLLMGRYRPSEHPFYSWYVWRDEIVNTCQEQLATPMLMGFAMGTVLVPLYLRLMGSKVGRDVWVENMNTTEFDLAHFGDGAVVGRGAVIETHLFHDRVMATGPVRLGAGATIGPSSVSLPDSTIGDGTVVGGRAIVMRGEELPSGTRWHGAPVVAQ